MNQDKDIHDELQGIAPHLSRIEKVEPFEVPASYFEEFPARVRDIIALKEAKPETGWLGQWIPRYSYIAASLCFLLIVGGFLVVKNTGTPSAIVAASQQTKATPNDEYVIEHVDEDVLMEPLPAANQETQATKVKQETPAVKNHTSNVSEQYILENVEESTITEEL